MGHRPKENNMTPEKDNIFGAFTEFPLASLEGVPTYDYMKNLNAYLNSCSSAFDCMLVCVTLVCLVLMAQPEVFNTHCGKAFLPPTNPGIHRFISNPAPTAAIFPKPVRNHKHGVCPFKEYHAVDRACKKVMSQLIRGKYYNYLSSRIIGFAKVTSLQLLTHLITEYAEPEDGDIQEIDRKTK